MQVNWIIYFSSIHASADGFLLYVELEVQYIISPLWVSGIPQNRLLLFGHRTQWFLQQHLNYPSIYGQHLSFGHFDQKHANPPKIVHPQLSFSDSLIGNGSWAMLPLIKSGLAHLQYICWNMHRSDWILESCRQTISGCRFSPLALDKTRNPNQIVLWVTMSMRSK